MIRSVLAVVLAVVLPTLAAAGPEEDAQKACNRKASDIRGAAKETFVKKCVAESITALQQQKLKDCIAEAKEKKLAGEERKTFVADCLAR